MVYHSDLLLSFLDGQFEYLCFICLFYIFLNRFDSIRFEKIRTERKNIISVHKKLRLYRYSYLYIILHIYEMNKKVQK